MQALNITKIVYKLNWADHIFAEYYFSNAILSIARQ